MSKIDDIRDNYSRKLDQEINQHERRVQNEIEKLDQPSTQQAKFDHLLADFGLEERAKSNLRQDSLPFLTRKQTLVDMTHSDPLKELDNDFLAFFNLSAYYPSSKINYPSFLCNSQDEFFGAMFADENISEQERKSKIDEEIEKLKNANSKIMGVNCPGQGCYVNGWQIAQDYNLPPSEINLQNQMIINQVKETATHEKLGHGFISGYSAMGELTTKMGLNKVKIASQFGAAPADNPAWLLLTAQWKVIFEASKFLEEGWATWIQGYLKETLFQNSENPKNPPFHHPIHDGEELAKAVVSLPQERRIDFINAFNVLFGDDAVKIIDLYAAMMTMSSIDNDYYDMFMALSHQPLRYVLGEFLCLQTERNLGVKSLPYAVLIAANITLNNTQISVSDLDLSLNGDPRLNPNTRLAAKSRIKLDHLGDLNELCQKVTSELSMVVPPELRK